MPWLTPVVFKQGPQEPLTLVPHFGDGPTRIRFRHVVHAYRGTAENLAVQALTFDTIDQARRLAEPDYQVNCVVVTYPADADLIPPALIAAPTLTRVVGDVAKFAVRRPLPLLFDILRIGASATVPVAACASEVDYLILTNSDIHLQPTFYRVLGELIRRGYDVVSVNRRTIDVAPGSPLSSALFFAEGGKDHAGFDCFVFPADMLDRFASNACCCGAGHVMRSLLFNLVALAKRFLMLTHAQMTFHLGDDRPWADPRFADYVTFNITQAQRIIAALATDRDKAKQLSDFVSVHEMDAYRKLIARLK